MRFQKGEIDQVGDLLNELHKYPRRALLQLQLHGEPLRIDGISWDKSSAEAIICKVELCQGDPQ